MNSPFANIFLALQQHIQAQIPAITYIDQDLGQLKPGIRPPVAWPCMLIDFEEFDFENMGDNVQTAKGTVVLRLGFAPYSNTGSNTPSPYLEQALGFYDIEWAVHRVSQGWSPGDDYGHLIRTSVTTQKRPDNYRVRELRYSLAFQDYSTKPGIQYVPASIILSPQLQFPA